jgi:hypothetical protein
MHSGREGIEKTNGPAAWAGYWRNDYFWGG